MLRSAAYAQPRGLAGLPQRLTSFRAKLIARSIRPDSQAGHQHTTAYDAAKAPVSEDVEEWEEEYYPTIADTSVPTVYASAPPPPSSAPIVQRVGSGAFYAAAAFLGATFLVAVVNFWRKFNLRENRERRKRLKNLDVVTTLSKLLPSHREAVTKSMIGSLRFKTGFTATEIFRKFLWYVLRDRQFNQDALDDLLHLKRVMQLSDDDVAQALKERSIRIEAKYGNLMLQTAGLSEKAVLKKATCRALFSKMLYLAENEQIISPDNTIFSLNELRNIFGATEEDVSKLRIVSLQEVDLDVLNNMISQDDSGTN